MWLGVDSDHLAPLGQGKKKARGNDAASAAASSASSASAAGAAADAWRHLLRRGYMCDVADSTRKWYQAVVVEHKEDEGVVSTVKVLPLGFGSVF